MHNGNIQNPIQYFPSLRDRSKSVENVVKNQHLSKLGWVLQVAMACVQLHSEMAMQAMRSIETSRVSEISLESKLTASSSTIPIIMPFEKSRNIILGP